MRIILFLILLCSAVTSCRNKTPYKAETNSAETKNSHQTNVFVAHEEAFAAMKPDVADSATCQRYSHDTIIMPYRFKYCVVNDDSDILKYIKYPDTDNQERDTVVYKGRKLCIMISDGKQIFKKEIHRNELKDIMVKEGLGVEDIEYMTFYYIDVKKKDDKTLSITIDLWKEDEWYIDIFTYEFDGNKISFKDLEEIYDGGDENS